MCCTDNHWPVSFCFISTEIQSGVRYIHLFDLQKEGSAVGCHVKFSVLKSITECNIAIRALHIGDAADVVSVVQFEPEYVRRESGKVGAQQCDVFTRLNLHSVKLRNRERDPA